MRLELYPSFLPSGGQLVVASLRLGNPSISGDLLHRDICKQSHCPLLSLALERVQKGVQDWGELSEVLTSGIKFKRVPKNSAIKINILMCYF
jgi:hypothetical protein